MTTVDQAETIAWTRITCQEREALMASRHLRPFASFTDTEGQHGDPHMFTEWGDPTTEQPVLRDYRWPGRDGAPDTRPCRHELAHAESTVQGGAA